MYKLYLLLQVATLAFSLPIESNAPTCGYSSCHPVDPEKITVHLIPHSHDDVGWLKTVDQYYFGARNNIQNAGVQYIIGSYVEALKDNPDRKFIQVETAFFWKWWQQQTEDKRNEYRDLINNGQIEIINGAWSMNDEADVNYQSTIDQFTWGLRTIDETVGVCGRPKVGWQIDPFGHSREMTSLYTQFGYEGFFVGRLDFQDKSNRWTNKNMDFLWQGSNNLENSTLFGNILVDFYISPSTFCFDIECSDEPINDDPDSFDYNLDRRVDEFTQFIRKRIGNLKTKNLLVPMGGDFQYQAALTNFINLDKLIAGFNKNKSSDIQLIYSTPSCYMKAVNDAMSPTMNLTLKYDDFFPYASDPHSYWTGYFSSRATSKRFERTGNNILQAAKQLATFASLKDNAYAYDDDLIHLREAMGIMQHHDAITGTEKEHVFKDYARILTRAITKAEENLGRVVEEILQVNKNNENGQVNLKTCLLSNVTVCETSLLKEFSIAVYNPLSSYVNFSVQIPVTRYNYQVVGPEGPISSSVLWSISYFPEVKESIKPTGKVLQFNAKNIPPLGMSYYQITDINEIATESYNKTPTDLTEDLKFGTNETFFVIDHDTRTLKSITMNGISLNLTQQFYYYSSAVGDNEEAKNRSSGAYIFRPDPANQDGTLLTDHVIITLIQDNDDIAEVHQEFGNFVKQIVRVNKKEQTPYVEFDWLVGPIEVNETTHVGKEIITRFILPSDFNSSETFFTDSNGREMLERRINRRPDYVYNFTNEPVSGNYYPVTSRIRVQDKNRNIQMAVLNDRAQGGTHLIRNGCSYVELMVHRRILHDDAFGVGEALNETEYGDGLIVRGQHYLLIGPSGSNKFNKDGLSTTAQERLLAQRILLQPWVLVANSSDNRLEKTTKEYSFQGLTRELPKNVHLLTLESWKNNSYIIRLEHIFEKGEDDHLSTPVEVKLKGLVANLTINSIRETTLAANDWLDEFNERPKLSWRADDGTSRSVHKYYKPIDDDDFTVVLNPMEIRTFIVNY